LQAANPVPSISLPLVPNVVEPGSPGFTLTVNGTGFVTGSTVTWNGASLNTTFVNPSRLMATVPANDVATQGSVLVAVVNPPPGGGRSNATPFIIAAPVGNVTFAPSTPVTTSEFLYVVLADFNRDGNMDAAGIAADNHVSVTLGSGDGSFRTPLLIALPVYLTMSIVAGDFNGDGRPDIAVLSCNQNDFLCQSGGTLSVLLGNGDGTFANSINTQTSGLPSGLVSGDFNGDGLLDVAVSHSDRGGTYSVFLGNGDGTFRPLVETTVSAEIFSIASGDFNADGKPDLVLGVSSPLNGLAILLGNGDGTFSFTSDVVLAIAGGFLIPTSIAAVDLNNDGQQDLVTTGQTYVAVVLGSGNGNFGTPTFYSIPAAAGGVAAADVNADGRMDIAVGDGQQTVVSVLLGNGDGTLLAAQTYPAGTQTFSIASTDLNKDGFLDLVFGGNGGSLVTLVQTTVQFSPAGLTFPSEPVGNTSPPQTVTLTNGGNMMLTISGIMIIGTHPGDFAQTNNCGNALSPGGQCTITVTFTPTAGGTCTAAIAVSDNAAASPQTVGLTGRGLAPAVGSSTGSFTWNTQPAGAPAGFRHLNISNTGTATLTIQSITITGADRSDFAITNNNCGSKLAPGKVCSPTLRFTPQAAGVRTAALTITDNAPDSPQSVSLSGTGTFIALSPEMVNFGSVTVESSSAPASATITNTGASAVTINSIALGGSKPGDYAQTNNCPATLKSGGSCTVTVTFTPTATGPRPAAVIITDSDAGSPQKVYLSGTGK
jgi:hypothetical protein